MSRAYSTKAQRAENDRLDHPLLETGTCCAPGCKLPATMASSTTGSSEWYCRVHFGASYADYADITMRANNRIGLYRMALRWSNEPPAEPVSDEARETLRRFRCTHLLSGKPAIEGRPLTMRTLARYVLAHLDDECRNGSSPEPAPEPNSSGDTWTSSADATAEVF